MVLLENISWNICEYFVKILWIFRENFVNISFKFREYFVKILWIFHENFVKFLSIFEQSLHCQSSMITIRDASRTHQMYVSTIYDTWLGNRVVQNVYCLSCSVYIVRIEENKWWCCLTECLHPLWKPYVLLQMCAVCAVCAVCVHTSNRWCKSNLLWCASHTTLPVI